MSSGERKSRTQIIAQNCDQPSISALTNIYFKVSTGESIRTVPRRGQLTQPRYYSEDLIKIKKSSKQGKEKSNKNPF